MRLFGVTFRSLIAFGMAHQLHFAFAFAFVSGRPIIESIEWILDKHEMHNERKIGVGCYHRQRPLAVIALKQTLTTLIAGNARSSVLFRMLFL
jgi:hypothetical protein